MNEDPTVRFEALYAALARSREEARRRLDRVQRQEGVRPGDVYLAPDFGAEPVYLVVTGAAGRSERCFVLLADDNAALRADLDLRTSASDGALLSVRTDRRAALPAAMLPARGASHSSRRRRW